VALYSLLMTENFISFNYFHPHPLLVVISGPSGVGKDVTVRAIMERGLPFHFVVTTTSRPMRPGEAEGVDYHFVSKEQFESMIANDEMLEHSIVYNEYKGIPKAQIRNALNSGKDVILRLDVQGAEKIRRLCPGALLIFLLPTDQDEWITRLRERKTETPETFSIRVETVKKELTQLPNFDYVVVNAQNRLEDTVDRIVSIVDAEHHRVNPRQITL
jgi:guanylate kinase